MTRQKEPEILTPEERRTILELARDALERAVRAGDTTVRPWPPLPLLQFRGGAFVTLKRRADGTLRGCVGRFPSSQAPPLGQTIQEMAVAAALSDPRFPPVRPEELDELRIEVSIIPELERIEDPYDFEPGVHGRSVRLGARSGTLLPQVATEYGADREQFLRMLAQKAGLRYQDLFSPGTIHERYRVVEIEEP